MTQVPRQSIQQRISKLSNADVVKVANRVLPDFGQQPPAVRVDASVYLPNRGPTFLETQATRARQFLGFWIDAETMAPDRLDYWTKAVEAP